MNTEENTRQEKEREYDQKRSAYRNEKFKCECGGRYSRKNKTTHDKTDRHNNFLSANGREVIKEPKVIKSRKEYMREYDQQRKSYKNEKFKCECGGRYSRKNKSGHEKSKKHRAFMKK